ncbi:EXS-domain-containing protein [Piedraia hortae CBS 480.64]|uniref:EXS-domain-containing protein n=1 Tax=Piedraia hortae CBS 480.64 TaxID=1314780 RepID=A0A6A7BUB4_9PEZI|nr:EXS-domain-containing protein [Piedraia hortae CBS 480.64]
MKFAKELEEKAIPEWRDQYLDYKGGKKKLKAVSRALREVDESAGGRHSFRRRRSSVSSAPARHRTFTSTSPTTSSAQNAEHSMSVGERSPLRRQVPGKLRMTRYGSIIGSPPRNKASSSSALNVIPALELPPPAMPGDSNLVSQENSDNRPPSSPMSPRTTSTDTRSVRPRHVAFGAQGIPENEPSLQPTLSATSTAPTNVVSESNTIAEAKRHFNHCKAEFFSFLDQQLDKIEDFYREKEESAAERLEALREQLHILREQRMEDISATREQTSPLLHGHEQPVRSNNVDEAAVQANVLRTSAEASREILGRIRHGRPGKTSKAMGQLGSPQGLEGRQYQDYTRRDANKVPPYRAAKRKLKLALAEYYRGLELVKSYALLNRVAFRKITKKLDKVILSNQGQHYIRERVEPAYFVQSDALETMMQAVEDLYARYFERGNRKAAVGKLRNSGAREGAYYAAALRTGLVLGTGAVFGIQGLVQACIRLSHPLTISDETTTNFLLQLYAGYLLLWLLVMLFCIDAAIFTKYRINYPFIFEFDARSVLNWKEAIELPAWFGLLLGFAVWLNFSRWSPDVMYIYWPVVLVGAAAILFCLPPPFFYWSSRRWMLVSNFRLLLAGVYPVEFRDFFLGDMYCSQTYSLGNIELFFCLYAKHWQSTGSCGSSQSRTFGFLQTLPGIWRLLQCLRRYHDSGLWTHLANAAKYTCTILQYASLSVWRISGTSNHSMMAFFIVCAASNSIYCTFWDLNYDWSMSLDASRNPPLLRDGLSFRKHLWWYYAAMALDAILRWNWTLYIIFRHSTKHNTIVSFCIALSEVFRRGVWVIFRVENEHVTNVTRLRAQRDLALPYKIPDGSRREESTFASNPQDLETGQHHQTAEQQVNSNETRILGASVVDMIRKAGSTFRMAHSSDYERKKPEDDGSAADVAAAAGADVDDEDDDDDDGTEDEGGGG